jgi:hypothetical protein
MHGPPVDSAPPRKAAQGIFPRMVAVSPRRARAVAALLCTVDAAAGHVAMLDPPSWSDAGGKGWQKDWQYTLGNEPQVHHSCAAVLCAVLCAVTVCCAVLCVLRCL